MPVPPENRAAPHENNPAGTNFVETSVTLLKLCPIGGDDADKIPSLLLAVLGVPEVGDHIDVPATVTTQHMRVEVLRIEPSEMYLGTKDEMDASEKFSTYDTYCRAVG